MPGKFKISFMFLLIIFNLYSIESKKVSLFFIYKNSISKENYLYINNLIDLYESNVTKKYDDVNFKFNYNTVNEINIKQISNLVYDGGGNCYYIFDTTNDGIDVTFYSMFSEKIYNEKIKVNTEDGSFSSIDNYLNSLDIFFTEKKASINKFSEKKLVYIHDFPYINISMTAVSIKLYVDARTTSKMFSFFPIDFKLSYFPLRYMEVGLFVRFDVGEMVYKYHDLNNNVMKYYDSPFDLSYGFFCGLSLFSASNHYSIGIQMYNIYYSIATTNYKKPDITGSFFLPQFAFYQKLDFRIYKFVYYTIYFNIKTMPLFFLESQNFYSKPFSYDFLNIEFSLVGLSITF
jgi:hypothetical protein